MLLNHFNTGWVTFDDVLLTRVGQETVIKRSSYGIAGQIAAIRISGDPVSGNDGISYFYNDHLGSNTALRKPDGSRVSTYYLPFGGYRPGSAPTQTITDRDFTGQRENMELGLLYYQARFYVPGIGRFASADTIIPNPANPQSYNRYSYVRNRVLNFTDPTGHRECGASDDCSDPLPHERPPVPLPSPYFIPDTPPFDEFPVSISGNRGIGGIQGFGPTQLAYNHRQGIVDEWYRQLGNLHSGIDIPLVNGTNLVALDEGTIKCVGINCGLSSNSDGADGLGIAIYYPSCNCVVYYVHLQTIAVESGKVTKGQVVGTSGTSRHGNAHLHFEIRPYEGAATWYNPLYFFTSKVLTTVNLSFMPYRNNHNEWSFYGYTSKQNGVFGKYWIGTLPQYWID